MENIPDKTTILTPAGAGICAGGPPDSASFDASDGHIGFEGLANTRDLGYLSVADGARIRAKRLLRSGSLAYASANDIKALKEEYRLCTVFDFRTEEERLKSPDPEDAFGGVSFVALPVFDAQTLGITREKGLKGLLSAIRAIEGDPAKIMIDIYPQMMLSDQSRKGYTAFFNGLLTEDEGALLWHCSVGKDRAGIAAALLLQVLGATQEAIMADYLATNRHVVSRTQEIADALAAHHLAKKLDASIHVLNSADPRFLQAALDAAVQEYGSLDSYLRKGLEVTPDKATALREKFVEGA